MIERIVRRIAGAVALMCFIPTMVSAQNGYVTMSDSAKPWVCRNPVSMAARISRRVRARWREAVASCSPSRRPISASTVGISAARAQGPYGWAFSVHHRDGNQVHRSIEIHRQQRFIQQGDFAARRRCAQVRR